MSDEIDWDSLTFSLTPTDNMYIAETQMDEAWMPGDMLPYGDMKISPAAGVLNYGQGLFEGMKAYKDSDANTWLFRPEENFNRLNKSAKRLAIPELPKEVFFEGLKALLKVDNDWIPTTAGSSLYIRPIIFATGEGFHASPADGYRFLIATAPSGPYFSGKVSVLIEEKYSRSANGGVGYAKAGGNYAGQFYPTQLAIERGYNQVIWTDDNTHEYIEEAGAMNIFIRIDDTLITGPTSDRILDGVTRKSIIDIAKSEGIAVEVRKFTVSEVIDASNNGSLKEMFGAGTAAVISPISSFGFRDQDYDLPELEKSYASLLKEKVTSIQTNTADDPFGWRFKV